MIQSCTEIAIKKNLKVSSSILQTEFINLKTHPELTEITEWMLFPNDNAHPIHGSQIESLYSNLLVFGWTIDLHSTPLAINL